MRVAPVAPVVMAGPVPAISSGTVPLSMAGTGPADDAVATVAVGDSTQTA